MFKQFWRPGDVLLHEDETIIRLFPPLRACWALRGAQASVPITGRNEHLESQVSGLPSSDYFYNTIYKTTSKQVV
jgi:hypothetical protein